MLAWRGVTYIRAPVSARRPKCSWRKKNGATRGAKSGGMLVRFLLPIQRRLGRRRVGCPKAIAQTCQDLPPCRDGRTIRAPGKPRRSATCIGVVLVDRPNVQLGAAKIIAHQ